MAASKNAKCPALFKPAFLILPPACTAVAARHNPRAPELVGFGQGWSWGRLSPTRVCRDLCKLVNGNSNSQQPRLVWEGMWASFLLICICKHGCMQVTNRSALSYLEEWEVCLRKMTFEKVTICLPVFYFSSISPLSANVLFTTHSLPSFCHLQAFLFLSFFQTFMGVIFFSM